MTGKLQTGERIDALFLWTFVINVLIPKAGFKLGGIPITFGNVMIFCLILYSLIVGHVRDRKIGSPFVLYFFGVCFWCLRFAVSFESGSPLSELIGYLVPLCVYPAAFFIAPLFLRTKPQIERISRILYWCLLVLFCYTMLQALFGIGSVDIPGITVNYSDYQSNPSGWWLDKNNAVGDASKMISTYQNGNLFGVTIILLFPIALSSEKKMLGKMFFWVLFVLSVLLSGSRTVYLGLILLVVYYAVRGIAQMRVRIGTIVAIGVAGIAVAAGVVFVVTRFAPDMFDRVMSLFDLETMLQGAGRTDGAIRYFQWLARQPVAFLFGAVGMDYSGFAYEMTYVCVFLLGGLVGFMLFMGFLLSAVGRAVGRLPKRNALARAFFIAIVVYWVIAFVEGGYWLPPVAWNVWAIVGIARCYGKLFIKEDAKKPIVQKDRSTQII